MMILSSLRFGLEESSEVGLADLKRTLTLILRGEAGGWQ
jgi:hypothetical protein